MARTGLRMMPTSPSPPLKFRTAGFPQYGFKASMSDRAFLQGRNLKLAPGIRFSTLQFASTLRSLPPQRKSWLCVQDYRGLHAPLFRRLLLLTPGVLGSGSSYVVSIPPRLLRPHAPVSPARCDFAPFALIRSPFAVRERLGDPRDLPYFCYRAFPACCRPYPGGPPCSPVVLTQWFQASSNY